MSLTWCDLKEMVDATSPIIEGARLQRFFSPNEHEIYLKFHGGQKKHLLWLSTAVGKTGGCLLPDGSPPSSYSSPFLLTVKKLLVGRRLAKLDLPHLDRTLTFDFGRFKLVCELHGKKSNLLVLDEHSNVVDAKKKSLVEMNKAYAHKEVGKTGATKQSSVLSEYTGTINARIASYLQAQIAIEKKQRLLKEVRTQIKRQEKKVARLKKEQEAGQTAEQYLEFAEAIKYNLHKLDKEQAWNQDTQLAGPNGPVTLPIDKPMLPLVAMEHFFRHYKKLQRKQLKVGEHLKAEVEALDNLLVSREKIENTKEDPLAIDELEKELLHQPSTTSKKAAPAKKSKYPSGIAEHVAPDGTLVLVGKSATANDQLLKLAKGNDMWLHVRDFPGSHCIVVRQGRQEISQATMTWAAKLALKHSKAKTRGEADVEIARRADVKKFKKAKPGQVRVMRSRSIYVKL